MKTTSVGIWIPLLSDIQIFLLNVSDQPLEYQAKVSGIQMFPVFDCPGIRILSINQFGN